MRIPFYKYQGTGNDFVVIDQRRKKYIDSTNVALINNLCNRRFGIGGDGLMLLTKSKAECVDFTMTYFNADGNLGSMCGNGGRCLTAFAHSKKIFESHCVFDAVDGLHEANFNSDETVSLKFIDVDTVEIGDGFFVLNTGSPHYVVFVEDLNDINVFDNGQQIRYSERFAREGINVNFCQILDTNKLRIATYERGVENETFSCGTGIVATVLSYSIKSGNTNTVAVETKGGNLSIAFNKINETRFNNIWLTGPAVKSFEGYVEV